MTADYRTAHLLLPPLLNIFPCINTRAHAISPGPSPLLGLYLLQRRVTGAAAAILLHSVTPSSLVRRLANGPPSINLAATRP